MCEMVAVASDYLGIGVYSVSDASRLTTLSHARIRNWVNGYTSRIGGVARHLKPVMRRQLPILDDQTAIGFLDLVEIRVIAALLKRKFSLQAIRKAHKHAQELFKSEHPFAFKKFRTGASG